MLTKFKKQIQQMLTSQANAAYKIGLTPNHISAIGFILAFLSAIAYLFTPSNVWLLLVATTLLLASGFCDTLDGIVARTFNQTSVFGGFFDSILDRYADAVVYGAIIVGGLCNTIWGLAALAGSIMVSYTRARAEAAGIRMESIGIAERAERMLILAVVSFMAFFIPNLGIINLGIIILAVLSNLTAIQRALYVFNTLKKKAAA